MSDPRLSTIGALLGGAPEHLVERSAEARAQAQAARGQGIYFYLPKTESPEEATLYRDLFASIQNRLPGLNDATIRGILLVESLPIVWTMEESLHALGPYAAGLNAARWDLKASLLEYVMADRSSLWPDRFGVAVPTTPFIANIFRRLVAICLKHNAVPIGGMATALPHRDQEVNEEAAASVRGDKTWEAQQGFLRGWAAHIYHMKSAAGPFKELRASGWTPSTEMADPANHPLSIDTPQGPVTQEGTRQNARTLIEYVEGWLSGRGAKGIDRLAGHPGRRPALMEDLATARISVAQLAQRVLHHAAAEATGATHDLPLLKSMILAEGEDIIRLLGNNPPAEMVLPDAADHDPRRQGMVPVHQPLGQGQTPSGLFGSRPWRLHPERSSAVSQHRGHPRTDQPARTQVIAPPEQIGGRGGSAVPERPNTRLRLLPVLQPGDLALQLPSLPAVDGVPLLQLVGGDGQQLHVLLGQGLLPAVPIFLRSLEQ